MKNLTLLVFLFSLIATFSFGQKKYFSNPVSSFSKKKTSYVTLKKGTELVGTIKKFDRKKGLFEGIVLVVDGKKKKLEADEISHMYLYPSGLQSLVDFYDLSDNASKVVDHTMNSDLLKDGYVYFEQTECYYKKKKKKTLLLQLLNPGFSGKVKVYFDPYAGETASIGMGSFKVAGGDEKSYFIKKADDAAFKLKKKNYKDTAGELFSDCSEFFDTIKSKLKWGKLGEHVLEYSSSCN